jgi:hypothetical protein
VQAQRTPASMTDVRAALAKAIEAVTGQPPRSHTLDVLSAQVSLETAHGGAMFNFNFGGIKGASPAGGTAHYMTHEILGGHDVKLEQGFRAYGSLDDGARDYVSVLQARFPHAFGSAMVGDIGGFAHALKQAHYYTASEQDYAAGLQAAAGMPSRSGVAPANSGVRDYSTTADLTRVLDAIASSATRIADPDPKT